MPTSHPWRSNSAAGVRWMRPACAGSTLRRAAPLDAGARSAAPARGNRCRFARITPHGRELGGGRRSSAARAHAHQGARCWGCLRLACDLAAVLSERDVLRDRAGLARCGFAAARERTARQLPRPCRRGFSVDSRALQAGGAHSANWQREFGAGAADSADPDTIHRPAPRARLSGSHCPRARTPMGDTCSPMVGARAFPSPRRSPSPSTSWRRSSTAAEREARIFLAAPVATRRSRAALRGAHHRAHRHRVGSPRAGGSGSHANGASARWCSNPTRFAIRTGSSWRRPRSAGLRQMGACGAPWSEGRCRQWQARVRLMREHVRCPRPSRGRTSAMRRSRRHSTSGSPPWIDGFVRREHFAQAGFGQRAARASVLCAEPRFSSAKRRRISWCRADPAFPSTTWTARCRRCRCACRSCLGSRPRRRVAGGRLPLLLKLLSPAGRPGANHARSCQLLEPRLPRGQERTSRADTPSITGRTIPLTAAADAPRTAAVVTRAAADRRSAAAANRSWELVRGAPGARGRHRSGRRQYPCFRRFNVSMRSHCAGLQVESARDTNRTGGDGADAIAADHSLRAIG